MHQSSNPDQHDALVRIVDRVKNDERPLDTEEYVALIQDALSSPGSWSGSRWASHDAFVEAAGRAADECRRLTEEATEEPPPMDQAFVAGALWALGEHPEYDVPTWTFFGHWTEDGELIIDHHIAGEHQDLREDDGHHPGGLWCDSASAVDVQTAEARLRETYESS